MGRAIAAWRGGSSGRRARRGARSRAPLDDFQVELLEIGADEPYLDDLRSRLHQAAHQRRNGLLSRHLEAEAIPVEQAAGEDPWSGGRNLRRVRETHLGAKAAGPHVVHAEETSAFEEEDAIADPLDLAEKG